MKSFIVVGLGRFGYSVALNLAKYGNEVLVIDDSADLVQKIADNVTKAIIADATDEDVIRSLGVHEFDAVILGIGSSLEASVLSAAVFKECGAKFIVAKAHNRLQGAVLEKMGVDRIIYPESDIGARVAKLLSNDFLADMIELSDQYSIMEIHVPTSWVGKNIRELNVRVKHGLNILAIKNADGQIRISDLIDVKLSKDDLLIVLGNESGIEKIK